MPSQAKMSMLSRQKSPYDCQFEWPADAYLQAGDGGIVLAKPDLQRALTQPKVAAQVIGILAADEPAPMADAPAEAMTFYRTAFFEAFLKDPNTFIRGEGKTVAEAEAHAWAQLERIRACPGHDFETRGYTNGCGFCKHCALFMSGVFPAAVP
jgi:hypothetical protein